MEKMPVSTSLKSYLVDPRSTCLQSVFTEDVCLFHDLLSNKRGNSDIDPLVKRLRHAQKCLSKFFTMSGETTPCDELNLLVEVMLRCMWCCAENIRLGREIEKLMEMLWERHPELTKRTVASYLKVYISGQFESSGALTKVSFLLDQSSALRSLCEGQLPELLSSLLTTVCKITREKGVLSLTRTDQDLLYTSVKVSLQVFQYYSEVVSPYIWLRRHTDSCLSHDSNSDLRPLLEKMLKEMIYILKTEGFSADCVLLTGTALMFLLNTAPTPHRTGSSFWRLFYQLGGNGTIHLGELVIPCPEAAGQGDTDKLSKLKTSLGHLALLRGFVMSAQTETLTCITSHCEEFGESPVKGDNSNIQKLYHPIFDFCKGPVSLCYLAFQVLSKWYKKMLHIIHKCDAQMFVLSSIGQSNVLPTTWDLIRLNCDSPVDNVAEFCVEICSMMLELEQCVILKSKENHVTKGGTVAKELTDVILEHVVSTSWSVKSRYKLLRVALSFIGISKVETVYPDLAAHLLLCLSTSTLAVSATDVYRAWLHQIRSGTDDIGLNWTSHWWDFIEQAVTSDLSLLRHNAMVYLIPTTLKTVPELSDCLQTQITTCLEKSPSAEHRNRALLAWVSVMKVIRSMINGFKVPEETLSEAAFHSNDDIRSAAIGLLCTTLKTAEPLSESEDWLLRKTLPLNLNIDSASFRQRLMGDVKKLAIRCRDSGLALVRSAHKHKDLLARTVGFVDWLLELCMTNLHPGVSFQRRKTCLEIFQLLLQIFTRFHESKHKKGQDQEHINKFMNLAKGLKKMDFYSADNWICILHCIVDGTDEVQTLASTILVKYFPNSVFDDPCERLTQEGAVCQILSHGLLLCNTAWSPNNNSGSLLCQYVWNRYICDEGWRFDIHYDTDTNRYSIKFLGKDKEESAVDFLQFVIRDIEEAVDLSEHSPVRAAESRPIQGMFNLLNALLSEKGSVTQSIPWCQLSPLLENLMGLCLKTSQLMSSVVAGGDNSESCVSFADIATSLETLLPTTSGGTHHEGDRGSHSSYRPLLTWCANNTKESLCCIGRIVEMLLSKSKHETTVVQLPWLQRLGDEFLSVFIRHRHWGAIDGCRLGFLRYCTALFSSSHTELCSLPKQLLTKVLEKMTSSSAASSVTRRSGGLPVLIQTIIVSEKAIGQSACLNQTLETLLGVASSPLPAQVSQTEDLPQVDAINMLNTLFCDGGLVHLLVGYVSPGLVLVIHSFSSHSWAIRNSATQLFSTLISRVFGQRKGGSDSSLNSMTVTEFSAHYPELCPLIVTKLEEARKAGLHSIAQLPPVLFPVLTILSHLAPQNTRNSFTDSIREVVCLAAYSPVYSLRELAAKALPALLQPSERHPVAEKFLLSLSSPSFSLSANYAHGILQQVDKLLEYELSNTQMLNTCLSCLLKTTDWLVFKSCDLVKAKYLEVVTKCWKSLQSGHSDLKSEVQSLAQRCVLSRSGISPRHSQAGEWLYCVKLTELLFTVYDWDSEPLQQLICSGLTSATEMRPAYIQCLRDSLKSRDGRSDNKAIWQHVQVQLLKSLTNYSNHHGISECLDLIVEIHEVFGPLHAELCPPDLCGMISVNDLDPSSVVSAQFLEISAICMEFYINSGTFRVSEVDTFSQKLEMASDSNATNRHQMAAARSLCFTGYCILTSTDFKALEQPMVRIIVSTFNLLHHVQPEIRTVACRFVCSLPRRSRNVCQSPHLQTAVCIQMLCEFVTGELSWSDLCVQRLCERLYQPAEIQPLLSQSVVSTDSPIDGREYGVEGKYLHSMIKTILEKTLKSGLGQDIRLRLSSSLVKTVVDLEACCQSLDTCSAETQLFSPLVTPVSLSCLTRLLLFTDICLLVHTPDDPQVLLSLNNSVLQLSKMMGVKPYLGVTLTSFHHDDLNR